MLNLSRENIFIIFLDICNTDGKYTLEMFYKYSRFLDFFEMSSAFINLSQVAFYLF